MKQLYSFGQKNLILVCIYIYVYNMTLSIGRSRSWDNVCNNIKVRYCDTNLNKIFVV